MNTHSGFFSPSNLLSVALIAAISLAVPRAEAALTVSGDSSTINSGSTRIKLSGSGPYTVTGSGTTPIMVQSAASCEIILKDCAISCASTASYAPIDYYSDTAATKLKIKIQGTVNLSGSNSHPGIHASSGHSIAIIGDTDDAKLTVSGSQSCAGIGGASGESAGSIAITNCIVTATGGSYAAGIGGGNGTSTSKRNGGGGTVDIYGSVVVAKGGTYGAGIGGGRYSLGGETKINYSTVTATGGNQGAGIGGGAEGGGNHTYIYYGSLVKATGGNSAAGIGGGKSGAAAGFFNYGGSTVWASGGNGDGSTSDIGRGASSSNTKTYSMRIYGGSTGLANGYVSGMNSASNQTDRVYRVIVPDLVPNSACSFDGLPDVYCTSRIVADADGAVHLWLPNGSYEFADEDYIYTATVNGAKTTATRTAKPTTTTVTFKDWDGTTISEYTADPGATLTSPANPSRTGYTFTGWSPEAPSAFPEKDTTYTAQYTANQYTLTFYDEDGTTVLDTITQDCDSAVTASTPTKAGYILSGWSPDVPATMPAENLSFTAKWDLAPYFRLVSVTPGADGKVAVKYDSYNTDLTKGDFTLTVKDANGAVAATVTEWETAPSTEAGEQTAVWDAKDFISALENPADYTFTFSVGAEAEAKYLVIDFSNGSKTYLADVPEGGWTDEYKTTKLVLRKILGEGETATFTMGSPTTEAGRTDNETQHSVTLTKPYWMGVFEFTQGQWAAVKGSSPSCTFFGATRPVETVAWADLKGAITSYGETSATGSSFFGALRSLAGSGLGLNLPTEAEWEYACRAGTTSAFNDGSELTASDTRKSSALDAIAVYDNNSGDTTAVVGTKAPNAWGLYDMHGNVREWCHDQSVERTTDATDLGAAAATDPVASSVSSSSNPYRVTRGGSWYNYANGCRSARRTARFQENGTATVSGESYTGFRVAAREFAGLAKVGSQIDAENTVSATLGKKPRKGVVMMVY